MSELEGLARRRELVLLSCDLQRATLTRRLGNIQRNPVRRALGAAAGVVSKPMAWKLGTTAIALIVRRFKRKRSKGD
jgi:hypothetical protein